MEINTSSLLLTAFIAVIAPLMCELPIGMKLPMVVLEVIFGIVVASRLPEERQRGIVGAVRSVRAAFQVLAGC
jgi:hypothetical protein